MKINSIHISNLRTLKNIRFFPGKKTNLILGKNASGKTSVLESIYLLARAKSFRTNKNTSLIRYGENYLSIQAVLENQSGIKTMLNVKKNIKTTSATVSNKRQTKLSILARYLPLGIVTPETHKLIHEGPQNRRKFLDWGVFHVEHGYTDIYKRYQKSLNQRNRMLRDGNKNCQQWDKEFCKYAERLDSIRLNYFKEWKAKTHNIFSEYDVFNGVKFELKAGWPNSTSLSTILHKSLESDVKKGFTSVGPHRADIKITLDSIQAKENLSRGQLKLLSILMIISQMTLIQEKSGERPIILIDDLDAELDSSNQKIILEIIDKNNFQSFVSMINNEQEQCKFQNDVKVFHVEHGEIL